MKAKLFEIRDRMTMFPLLAVDMNPDNMAQRKLLRHVGYPCSGEPNIVITHATANGGSASNDAYHWGDRTFANAHHYILDHWDELEDGAVIDVEFILGETTEPVKSDLDYVFNTSGR